MTEEAGVRSVGRPAVRTGKRPVTCWLTEGKAKALKKAAIDRDQSLGELVEEAVDLVLERHPAGR